MHILLYRRMLTFDYYCIIKRTLPLYSVSVSFIFIAIIKFLDVAIVNFTDSIVTNGLMFYIFLISFEYIVFISCRVRLSQFRCRFYIEFYLHSIFIDENYEKQFDGVTNTTTCIVRIRYITWRVSSEQTQQCFSLRRGSSSYAPITPPTLFLPIQNTRDSWKITSTVVMTNAATRFIYNFMDFIKHSFKEELRAYLGFCLLFPKIEWKSL